ncbi:hypothetical protein GCM10009785_20360 [Brooklawnia cerclae]|uniref:Ribonuclease E n=1 Tax=Brooklawnia cerclae TaxID=349934 RepID=A0ABX0SFT0_9ACTN|nr:Rne/Rng family ribonuclease [Brooklawnia cerclae]NIH57222.1 ribonuclease E [Brooklawnia cerclae]
MLDNESQTPDQDDAAPSAAPAPEADTDLPRPPRGRRAATRPAGPPVESPAVPLPIETPVTVESAAPDVDARATGDADEASSPAVGPVAETPAPTRRRATRKRTSPSADESPSQGAATPVAETEHDEPVAAPARPPRRRSTRAAKTVVAEELPAAPAEPLPTDPAGIADGGTTVAETDAVADEVVTPAAEATVTEEPQDAGARPAPEQPARPARRRSARTGRASRVADDEPREQSPDLEAALEAIEAAAAGRARTSRGAATHLVGDEVPTDEHGDVDTEQVLASLAAAIASRGGSEETDEAEEPEDEATDAGELEPDADASADLDEDSTDDADDGAETQSSQRRRRRRGGRRRRRGSSAAADEGSDATEQTTDEGTGAEDTETESTPGEDEPDAQQAGTSTRRRRRRRRRGDDAGEEEGDVAVRVREPRHSATDEIAGIEGSTRLEAKKQRRREGRAAGRHRAPILTEAEFLARRESVDRVMVVRQRDEYTQIAVLEDEVLVEHYVDRTSSTSLIGNIYLGRVQNVLPSMEAVFIDIGRGRNAVLYAGEVDWNAFDVSADSRKVEQVFKSGQSVLVQVSKDPVGAKGARLTAHVSLPGRYVVYSPGGHLSGISRKLPDAERHRLKSILDQVVSENSSVIVRTAAEGASEEDLIQDVERLKTQWQVIEKKAKQVSAPQQLYAEPDLTLRIVRDTFTEDFKQLVVSGHGGPDDAYQALSSYVEYVAPHLADRIRKWDDADGDLFAKYRIDEQISKALERKVFLPSGGSLVIDRTEAMTVIDVNTGKFTGSGGNLEETVTRNNLEAAEEIVRQLRLRDLGGIIVIDFIDMVLPSNRELLLRRLVECLGRDRTRHQVSEVTSLGLVQMTRKRIGTGLAEAFTETCEQCGGRGYIRHDEPVDSQAPADGGERQGRSKGKGRSGRNRKSEAAPAAKDNQVHPSDAAREAAAKLAAASRHHSPDQDADEPQDNTGEDVVAEPGAAGADEAREPSTV